MKKIYYIIILIFFISCNLYNHKRKDNYNITDIITDTIRNTIIDTNNTINDLEDTLNILEKNINISKDSIIIFEDTTNTLKNNTSISNIPLYFLEDTLNYNIKNIISTNTDTNIDINICDTNIKLKKIYGNMYFINFDTMYVNTPKKIKFIISKKRLKSNKINNIFHTTNITTSKIRITNNIRVDLIDPMGTNFKINYIGSDTKQYIDSTITTWVWWVIPLTEGNNYLILCIDVFIDGSIHTERTNNIITVISNETIINKIQFFFMKYWQWFITTILIPFSIFIWKKKRKKV